MRTEEIRELLKINEENRVNFLKRLKDLSIEEIMNIDMAYDLAKESHRPQKRDDGERYFNHVRAVALILIDECKIINADLIISCLLHDTIEDSATFGNANLAYSDWKKTANYRLTKIFNETVATNVIYLTKPKIDGKEICTKEEAVKIYFDNLKQSPIDVVLIKMCDRLHNLRSLKGTNREKQIRICKETNDHYFDIFEKVKDKYPKQYEFLISEMKKEIFGLNC